MEQFKTPIFSVAYRARTVLPKAMHSAVEHDLHALLMMYSIAVQTGKRDELWKHIVAAADEICHNMHVEKQVCADWIAGARRPNGTCTNCGETH